MVTFSGYELIAVGSLVVAVSTACNFTAYEEIETWKQAQQTCTYKGMQLATIPDAEFNSSLCKNRDLVKEGNSTQGFWIGARVNKAYNNGSVQVDWIDGTGNLCSVTKLKGVQDICSHGQPGQCVYVNITDDWEDMQLKQSPCDSFRGLMCESLPGAGK